MEGPPSCPFRLSGYLEFKLGVNKTFTGCTFTAPGNITLKLPSGAVIDISSKMIEITGLMSKEKNFNAIGTMKFSDPKEKLTAVVSFDAQAKKRTGYWTSWVKGSDKVNKDSGVLDNRRDLINIQIAKEPAFAGEDAKVLAEAYGSYLENVSWDEKGTKMWDINDHHMVTKWVETTDKKDLLESDTSCREDVMFII